MADPDSKDPPEGSAPKPADPGSPPHSPQAANGDPGGCAPAPSPADKPIPAGARVVNCVKFGKPMEGLAKAPLKGELGQKIFDNVSKEAWRMWLEHSKMLINEFRLDLMSEQGQRVWMTELEKYFWGEGSQLPPDYVPHKHK